MRKDENGRPYGLLIEIEEDKQSYVYHGFWHIRGRLVVIDDKKSCDDSPLGEVRRAHDMDHGFDADHIRITSQGDFYGDGEAVPGRHRLYGWHHDYRDIYSADADDVAAMHKTSQKLRRYFDKAAERDGYGDFADFVGRFCKCLGVKHILKETPNSLNGYRYRTMTVADGVNWIRGMTQEASNNSVKMDALREAVA